MFIKRCAHKRYDKSFIHLCSEILLTTPARQPGSSIAKMPSSRIAPPNYYQTYSSTYQIPSIIYDQPCKRKDLLHLHSAYVRFLQRIAKSKLSTLELDSTASTPPIISARIARMSSLRFTIATIRLEALGLSIATLVLHVMCRHMCINFRGLRIQIGHGTIACQSSL